jgi:hypothetical protein
MTCSKRAVVVSVSYSLYKSSVTILKAFGRDFKSLETPRVGLEPVNPGFCVEHLRPLCHLIYEVSSFRVTTKPLISTSLLESFRRYGTNKRLLYYRYFKNNKGKLSIHILSFICTITSI